MQAVAREDFAAGRAEEMAERKRALDAQIALERLAQAGRITEIVITMARTAHDETLTPPPAAAGSQRATFIPSLQAQLHAALAVFYALGGPTLETTDDLASKAYSLTTQPIEILHDAGQRLCERQVGQRYGRWKVSANSTNTRSRRLAGVRFLGLAEQAGWRYHDGRHGHRMRQMSESGTA